MKDAKAFYDCIGTITASIFNGNAKGYISIPDTIDHIAQALIKAECDAIKAERQLLSELNNNENP